MMRTLVIAFIVSASLAMGYVFAKSKTTQIQNLKPLFDKPSYAIGPDYAPWRQLSQLPSDFPIRRLSNHRLKDDDIVNLLRENDFVALDLGWNRIGAAGAAALARASTLTTLYLSDNELGDDGAAALSTSVTIATLDLYNTGLTDAGAKALSKSNALSVLFASKNKIGDAGAEALAKSTTLKILYLDQNLIGDEGAKAFSSNNTLQILYIANNNFGLEGVQSLHAWKARRFKMGKPITIVVDNPFEATKWQAPIPLCSPCTRIIVEQPSKSMLSH